MLGGRTLMRMILMAEYYYSWYTLPESMLLDNPRLVWGVYRNVSEHLSWKVAVCDTEQQAIRLTEVLSASGLAVEVGV